MPEFLSMMLMIKNGNVEKLREKTIVHNVTKKDSTDCAVEPVIDKIYRSNFYPTTVGSLLYPGH